MFEKILEDFYNSLADSIKDRKKALKLKREEILSDPKRVTEITKATRSEHHPYLISKTECTHLYYLYLFDDRNSFLQKDTWNLNDHIKKNGSNYDKMLWGHIDWDKMFQDVITVLSTLDMSEDFGKLFDDTLIDYVPYAIIKYDELHPKYGKVYIFPEERGKERQNAINRVHLQHGSEFFKKTFLEKFKGKTLDKFDIQFNEFIENYLKKRKPNQYSLGLQAYNLHKNISGFAAYWQSFAEVQYSDMYKKKSDLYQKLDEYITNGRMQIQKLKKFQQDFDAFHLNID